MNLFVVHKVGCLNLFLIFYVYQYKQKLYKERQICPTADRNSATLKRIWASALSMLPCKQTVLNQFSVEMENVVGVALSTSA
jgi:hypothetical protein